MTTNNPGDLYRIAIQDSGDSDYWRVLDIGGDGTLWACLAVGQRDERILVGYDDVIIEANNPAYRGRQVTYTTFSR